jgi:hypothetical protein
VPRPPLRLCRSGYGQRGEYLVLPRDLPRESTGTPGLIPWRGSRANATGPEWAGRTRNTGAANSPTTNVTYPGATPMEVGRCWLTREGPRDLGQRAMGAC